MKLNNHKLKTSFKIQTGVRFELALKVTTARLPSVHIRIVHSKKVMKKKMRKEKLLFYLLHQSYVFELLLYYTPVCSKTSNCSLVKISYL